MSGELPPQTRTIAFTPEMMEIVDKLRGEMDEKDFLLLLLRIADSRAVGPTPMANVISPNSPPSA